MGTIKTAERAVRTAVRQQFLTIKLISPTFYLRWQSAYIAALIIELVIFLLSCGITLDMCMRRLVFMWYTPVTTVFYHWIVRTMFMFVFLIHSPAVCLSDSLDSILLGGYRQIRDSMIRR